MKIGLAFSTKDRTELTKQSINPLLQPDKFDLWWIDGSVTPEGEHLPLKYPAYIHVHGNVRGGADPAIVYALTTLLQAEQKYNLVGLCENDCLLSDDWFTETVALFEAGNSEGLVVGAVSARCYDDRILIQRNGYAVCHNLGAGMVLFTRQAAILVLQNFRTAWWGDNRRTFAQLSGIDIGTYGAFRANEQWCTPDWHFDNVLAQHGLASLALTPAKCEMIGQIPSLAEQGLRLTDAPVENLRNESAFGSFVERTRAIREGQLRLVHHDGVSLHQSADGARTIFPHQAASFGGKFAGDWRLKWVPGFGGMAWKAGDGGEFPFRETAPYSAETRLQRPTLTIPVSGPCNFLVSGGEKGGGVEIEDMASGYKVTPTLPGEGELTQVLNLPVPAGISYREIRLTMLTPGTIFYGIQVRDSQPWLPEVRFTHAALPPV